MHSPWAAGQLGGTAQGRSGLSIRSWLEVRVWRAQSTGRGGGGARQVGKDAELRREEGEAQGSRSLRTEALWAPGAFSRCWLG